MIESLICAGAFDAMNATGQSIHKWRACLHHAVDVALACGNRAHRHKSHGQNDLFGGANTDSEQFPEQLPDTPAWTHAALLAAEKNAIGFYITGHPLENYTEVLTELNAFKTIDLSGIESKTRINIGGITTALQVRTTKKGSRFGLMRLEDEAGGVKCVLWPEIYSKYEPLLQNDIAVLLSGRVEVADDGSTTIIAEEVARLDVLQRKARARWSGYCEPEPKRVMTSFTSG